MVVASVFTEVAASPSGIGIEMGMGMEPYR